MIVKIPSIGYYVHLSEDGEIQLDISKEFTIRSLASKGCTINQIDLLLKINNMYFKNDFWNTFLEIEEIEKIIDNAEFQEKFKGKIC